MFILDQKIDENVSDIIREFTTKNDRVQISLGSDCTTYAALTAVVYKENPVTSKHLPALKLLVKRAIEKATDAGAKKEILKLYV